MHLNTKTTNQLFTKSKRPFLIIFGVFIGLAICLSFCKNPATIKASTASSHDTDSHRKPPSSYFDSLLIQNAAAIFYEPDSLQLLTIKSITDASIFDGSMHEYYYQQRNARIILNSNWNKLPIILCKNFRYLVFKDKKKDDYIIDLDSFNDAYGIFLYKPGKLPELVDMTNFEDALNRYYH